MRDLPVELVGRVRHTVVRHGDRPDRQLDALTRVLLGNDPDRWRARAAAGLLNFNWDGAPRSDAEVSTLLNAALAAASADSKPEWEREIRHRFIAMLDEPDALIPSSGPSAPAVDPLLEGFEDRIEWLARRSRVRWKARIEARSAARGSLMTQGSGAVRTAVQNTSIRSSSDNGRPSRSSQ